MPNNRVIFWVALAALLYLNYSTWMHDYPPTLPPAVQNTGTVGNQLGDSVPQSQTAAASASAPALAMSTPNVPSITGAPTATTPADTAAPSLHVTTDVLDLGISLKGGELDRALLLQYPIHKDAPNIPVQLFDSSDEKSFYVLQTGLAGVGGASAPTHLAIWQAADKTYSLAAGANELRVPLTWSDGAGLTVTKTFVLTRGSYAIKLEYNVQNAGSEPRSLAQYSQILRHWEHASKSYFNVETYSFKGPMISDGTKTKNLQVENEADSKYAVTATNGWIASLQHHFATAVVPPAGQPYKIQLTVRGQDYLLNATGPEVVTPPGGKTEFDEQVFVGPKLQAQLETIHPELWRTVDYGRLSLIARPVFITLTWVHKALGNWGWSIVAVTALIKLLFYPLSQASGRSMAKMRAVGPRMKQIQDSYKDDREKLGRAMMELYKKEKINPLAGCLPMVVQIPFFISFYWVLLESVEMRQAPFMLWINDLSSRDPFFILPLFMGGAMFAQFKLNPAPPDPMQAKIMQFMPLVMTGMMAWFPSGLVLYWLTNTVLSIVQQWRVNQVVQAEAAKPRS